MSYILAHDLGTTGVKAALFDEAGALAASAGRQYPTLDSGAGGYEQNPADWIAAVAESSREALERASASPSDVAAISVSGHMMGVVALDAENLPVRPAILHSDIRSRAQLRAIRERIAPARVHQMSGNPLDVHYPWAKIAWLRDTEPENYAAASLFVQSKDYITAWMTGSRPVTDWSDASLYGCFDFHRMAWSAELCDAAGIDAEKLPGIVEAGTLAGALAPAPARLLGLRDGIPVYVGFGDGASAAVGCGCWEPGSVYNYVGSTSWVSVTTNRPVIDEEGRAFTLALTRDRFALLGTVQCAGAVWDWAVTRLCESHFEEAEALAASSPPGANGLLFLPYLSGERAPIWNDRARGVWFGLSTAHGPADLLRSVLEGVGFALGSVLEEIRRCTGVDPASIRLIGGAVRGRLLRDIIAACFGCPVQCVAEAGEATGRGAFVVAAVGSGLVSGFDSAPGLLPPHSVHCPDARLAADYEAARALFDALYGRLAGSFDDLARLRERLGAEGDGHAAL